MNKINIENLFNCRTNNRSKNLDVKAITQCQKPFDIDTLIETREKKRKTLLNYYIKFYDMCLKKIEIANNLGKTDLLYTVKEFIPNCHEYKPSNCIEYIKNKLQLDHFNICILNSKTLFITWLYIESNKETYLSSPSTS